MCQRSCCALAAWPFLSSRARAAPGASAMRMHVAFLRSVPTFPEYSRTLSLQQRLADRVRSSSLPGAAIACEHPPTYALGRASNLSHLKGSSPDALAHSTSASVLTGDRGGEVTFHGPGQAVIYSIINLRGSRIGPRALVHALEDSMVRVCALHRVSALGRDESVPGAWVDDRKIGAVGVRIKSGVSCAHHHIALLPCECAEPLVPHRSRTFAERRAWR